MEVVGGDGADTLVVPQDPEDGETNRVFISDIDKGSVTKTIGFSEVENLTGATGITDLFTFEPGAVLSGELYGQSVDQDSLVFQLSMGPDTQDLMWNTAGGTGTVSRNDSVITSFHDVTDTQNIVVFGTELSDELKVSTNQSKIEVEGGNSEVIFGAVTFYSPQGSLLIWPGAGDDTVTIHDSALSGPVTIDDVAGDADRLILELDAGTAERSVAWNETEEDRVAGTLTVSSATVQYYGIENSENLIISGTSGDDTLVLQNEGESRLSLSTADWGSPSGFYPVLFDSPGGALSINLGNGDDNIQLSTTELTAPLFLDGGVGTDRLNFGSDSPSIAELHINSTIESVEQSPAQIGLLAFTATEFNDEITVTLATEAAERVLISSTNSTFTNLVVPAPQNQLRIHGSTGDDQVTVNFGTDTEGAEAAWEFAPELFIDGQVGGDTLKVLKGQFQHLGYAAETIEMASGAAASNMTVVANYTNVDIYRADATHLYIDRQIVPEPTQKLTVIGDPSAGSSQTFTIKANPYGQFTDLTVDYDFEIAPEAAKTEIFVETDVFLVGDDLILEGTEITVAENVVISTNNPTGDSGDITMRANAQNELDVDAVSITLGTGSQLLATPSDATHESGDILLTARQYAKPFLPYFVLLVDTSATINLNDATVRGRDITITADSLSDSFFETQLSGADIDITELGGETILNELVMGTGLIFFSVSTSEANAQINLNADTDIAGRNITVATHAASNPKSNSANELFALSYARSEIYSKVNIASGVKLEATSDVTISSTALNDVGSSAASSSQGATQSDAKANITVAVAESVTEIGGTVSTDSQIIAGGDVDIRSSLIRANVVEAAAGGFDDGTVGISLAISLMDDSVTATAGGLIVAGGDVVIDAGIDTLDNIVLATSEIGVSAVGKTGGEKVQDFRQGIKDKNASAANGLKAPSAFILKKLGLVKEAKTPEVKEFVFSGALAIADHQTKTEAKVASDTKVFADGGVFVASLNMDKPEISAKSTTKINVSADKKEDPKKQDDVNYGISVAINVGVYDNDAYASIGSSAQVTAAGPVEVTGKTLQPYEISWLQLDGLNGITDKFAGSAGFEQGFFSSWTNASSEGAKKSGGGSIGYFGIANDAQAFIAENAHVNEYVVNGASGIDSDDNVILLGGPHYFEEGDIIVFQFPQDTSTIGLSSNTQYRVSLVDDKADKIRVKTLDGAVVDLTTSVDPAEVFTIRLRAPASTQDVVVWAEAESQTANLAGTLPDFTSIHKKSGSIGKESGAGGALLIANFENNVSATIQSGAVVHTSTLMVRADTGLVDVSFAVASGAGETKGFAGTGSVINVNNTTTASIADGARVTTGVDNIVLKRDIRALFGENNDGLIKDVADLIRKPYGSLASFDPNDSRADLDLLFVNPDTTFEPGQQVFYIQDGDYPAGGLTDSTTYYVIVEPDLDYQATQVDPLTNTLDLGYEHDFVTGDVFVWSGAFAYAIVDESAPHKLQLASSPDDAFDGIPLTLDVSDGTLIPKRGIGLATSKANAELGISINIDPWTRGEGTNHLLMEPDYLSGATVEVYPLALDSNGDGKLTDDDDAITASTDGTFTTNQSLLVIAQDDSVGANGLGAFSTSTGGGTGLGFTVGVNVINRDTQAFIGAEHGHDDTPAETLVDAGGSVTVASKNTGVFVISSIAKSTAKVDKDNKLKDVQKAEEEWETWRMSMIENDDPSAGLLKRTSAPVQDPLPRAGNSFSGAGVLAVSVVDDNVKSYVRSIESFRTQDLSVLSGNETILASLAATSANASGSTKNSALSGAVSYNKVGGDTTAYIDAAQDLDVNGELRVEADQAGYIGSITAGFGGATGGDTAGTAIAGSISVNEIAHNVDAHIVDSVVDIDSNVFVNAVDKSLIVSIAGTSATNTSDKKSTGVGSKGVGLALSVNLIGTSASPVITTAYIQDSTLTMSTGQLTVSASNAQPGSDPRIYSLAQSYGGTDSMQGTAIAGTVSVNLIASETKAYLQNATIDEHDRDDAAVAVNVSANDSYGIVAYTGGWASSSKGSGFGAALSYNEVAGTTQAYIDASTIDVSGDVTITADNKSIIGAGTLGVASGKGTSGTGLAGSVAIAIISNSIDAHISGDSAITTDGDVSLHAEDNSFLISAAGGVGIAGEYAAGAVIAYHRISNAVTAFIRESTVTAGGQQGVSVLANSSPLLIGIGLAAAISDSGEALAGNAVINSIANTVQASIENSTVIATLGDVLVNAFESAALYSAAIGYAGSDKQGGIGLSLAYNFLGGSYNVEDPNLLTTNDAAIAGTETDENSDPDQQTMYSAEYDDSAGIPTQSSLSAQIRNAQVSAPLGEVFVISGFDQPELSEGSSLVESTKAFESASVTLGSDLIKLQSHGFTTGDEVVYDSGASAAVGGLTPDRSYYVMVVDEDTIQLADSLEDIPAGHAVTLTSGSTGVNHGISLLDQNAGLKFAASSDTVSENRIVYGTEHGLTNGQLVIYSNGDGDSIAGLVDGHAYWVINADATSLQLAASPGGATLAISGGSGDNHVFLPIDEASRQAFDPDADIVYHVALANTIELVNHGLNTGDAIVYRAGSEANGIGGLESGAIYYVIDVDESHIRLSDIQVTADAEIDTIKPVILTSITGDSHQLHVLRRTVELDGEIIDLPGPISGQMTTVTLAGAKGNGSSISGAGAMSLNYVRADVVALIDSQSSRSGLSVANSGTGAVEALGDIHVIARDTSHINTGTGMVSKAGSGGSGVGAAIGVADIQNSVTAAIQGVKVTSQAGDVSVRAAEEARIINAAVGVAVTSGSTGFGFAGTVVANKIQNTIDAHISMSADVEAGGSVLVLAEDTASIATLAGAAARGGSAAVGAAIAVNEVYDSVFAIIDNSTVLANSGDIRVDASFREPSSLPPGLNSQIAALAISGATNDKVAFAGSFTINLISNQVEAKISNIGDLNQNANRYGGADIHAGRAIRVLAVDSSTSNSIAGALAYGGKAGFGASLSYTYLGDTSSTWNEPEDSRVIAAMENISGQVTAFEIEVDATYTGSILNVTIAGSGGGTLSIGGAVSLNEIQMTTKAYVTGTGHVDAGPSGIEISASNTGEIISDAGAFSFAWGRRATVSAGLSYSRNEIDFETTADIGLDQVEGVSITSAGDITVSAVSESVIKAISLAGALSLSNSSTAVGAAATGAISRNVITSRTNSGIRNRRRTQASHSIPIRSTQGAISVISEDDSKIQSLAIGASVAISSGATAVSVSISASIARNEINSDVTAMISDADVSSHLDTVVRAGQEFEADGTREANRAISAISVAASVSLASGSSQEVSLAGAGAESSNVILGDTTASVVDSNLLSDAGIQLQANDKSSISATVVAASIGAGSIGASVSDNSIGYDSDGERIGNKIEASSLNSTMNAVGALEVDAESSATITANVIAASIAVAKGSGTALSGSGSGVSTTNRVAQDVKASLDGDAQSSAPLASGIEAGSVALTATDTSVITPHAGAAALALSFGGNSGNLTISVGLARNVINNTVETSIKNVHQHQLTTPADTDGFVTLTATSNPSITAHAWAATVGFASGGGAAVSLSGAGAEAVNVILGSTKAFIVDSVLDASGRTNLTATTEDAHLDATVWGAAVSLAAGGGGRRRNFDWFGNGPELCRVSGRW